MLTLCAKNRHMGSFFVCGLGLSRFDDRLGALLTKVLTQFWRSFGARKLSPLNFLKLGMVKFWNIIVGSSSCIQRVCHEQDMCYAFLSLWFSTPRTHWLTNETRHQIKVFEKIVILKPLQCARQLKKHLEIPTKYRFSIDCHIQHIQTFTKLRPCMINQDLVLRL